ncbi:MAG: hypothetical protein ACRC2T_04435 [Thermoguttaceae bacterium]
MSNRLIFLSLLFTVHFCTTKTLFSEEKAPLPGMKRIETQEKNYSAMAPEGWFIAEQAMPDGSLYVQIMNPKDLSQSAIMFGTIQPGITANALVVNQVGGMMQFATDTKVTKAVAAPRADGGTAAMFIATYTDPTSGEKVELRHWFEVAQNGAMMQVRFTAKPKAFTEKNMKQWTAMIESIKDVKAEKLAAKEKNKKKTTTEKDAAKKTDQPEIAKKEYKPLPVPQLVKYEFPDRSATISIPEDWEVVAAKEANFGVMSKDKKFVLMKISFPVLLPNTMMSQLANQQKGVVVSEYTTSSKILPKILADLSQEAEDITIIQVNKNTAREKQSEPYKNYITAKCEDVVYMFYAKDIKAKCIGVALGDSFAPVTAANLQQYQTMWNWNAIIICGVEDSFESMVPTFAAISNSYKVNDEVMASIAQQNGETGRAMAESIAKHGDEMRNMISETGEYLSNSSNERFKKQMESNTYVNYLQTQAITGDQDWKDKDGNIYRTSSHGTFDTANNVMYTGKPFETFNFNGTGPNGEQLEKINLRPGQY